MDWRVLLVGTAGGFGRAEFADAGGAECRRHALHPKRAEDVDHQRRVRGRVHRVRESERRKIHGVHRGTHLPGIQAGQRRAQDGDSRQLDDADLPGKLQGAKRKRAARNRARAHRGVQYFKCRAVHAGRVVCGRGEKRSGDGVEVFERAESVWKTNWRLRDDEGKAGRDGHSDSGGGVDGLPLGGKH